MTTYEGTTNRPSAGVPRPTSGKGLSSLGTPVLAFILLSYVFAWTCWIAARHVSESAWVKIGTFSLEIPVAVLLIFLGDLGPGVAAMLVLLAKHERRGVKELWGRVIPRSPGWMVAVVLATVALVTIPLMCMGFPARSLLGSISLRHWLRVFAINIPFAPFWEELGWRGYLLPRLQTAMTPVAASVIIGVVWGAWHTPLYIGTRIPGSPAWAFLACFYVLALGLSFLFTWVYNATDGTLTVLILLHASINSSVIAFLGQAMAVEGMKPFLALTAETWIAVAAVVFLRGRDLSYKRT